MTKLKRGQHFKVLKPIEVSRLVGKSDSFEILEVFPIHTEIMLDAKNLKGVFWIKTKELKEDIKNKRLKEVV